MNAILSLCHFCELHGPRVVFNTQAFRDPPSLANIGLEVCQEEEEDLGDSKSKSTWKYGRVNKDQTFKSQPSYISETCSACRSFPHNNAAIISNDDENCVSFVSSQFPFQEEVFTLLRQAGIRSLSCEVYSEREGPIYFGDHARGHVISYTFFLKDTQARGFLRRYSILVLMADKMLLLNSWTFFIKYIQKIIKLLQDSACKVYMLEEKQRSSIRLKPPAASENSKRHRAAGNPRPLAQLVGEAGVWGSLHAKFAWILKAGGLRLQEKLVEGPPLFVPLVDHHRMSLKSLVEILSPAKFQKFLHHLYVGNKVLFVSSDERLLADVPVVVKPIVPLYLFHPLAMGAPEEATLEGGHDPSSQSPNVATLLSATPCQSPSLGNFHLQIWLGPETAGEEGGEWPPRYDVMVSEPSALKCRPPQIVSKILALVEKGTFSPPVLNLYFATLIDEWTNKVKIWSYMARDKNLQLTPKLPPPNSPEKKGPHSPTNTGGGTNVLLTVVGALECDIPLLTALAAAYGKAASPGCKEGN